MKPVTPGDFAGRYIHYGIREHGMAAAMNGIALHGGFGPMAAPSSPSPTTPGRAIRLSALMGVPVIYVMTHDSIGLGEDGPTHQPVEHLASLRAIPNLLVLRPADAVETAEAWELALAADRWPVVLILSRQNLPTLRDDAAENRRARGAYLLREPGRRDVTLIATGSEVEIALAAAERLPREGIAGGGGLDALLRAFRGPGRRRSARRCSAPRRASASRRRSGRAGIASSAGATASSA